MTLVLHTSDAKNEGSDFGWTLARVPGEDGTLLTIRDVQNVSLFVTDETDRQASIDQFASPFIYYTGLVTASVIFDTPQRDRRWTLPDQGYNFAHYLDAATAFQALAEVGGHTYALEYRITTTTANDSGVLWVIRKVFSSPVNAPRV